MLQDIRYALRGSLAARHSPFSSCSPWASIGANSAISASSTRCSSSRCPTSGPGARELYGAFRAGNQRRSRRRTSSTTASDRRSFRRSRAHGVWQRRDRRRDEPERVPASIATANYFSTLGVQPILGRGSGPTRSRAITTSSSSRTGLWQQRFGGTPASSAPASQSTDARTPSSASCRRSSTA